MNWLLSLLLLSTVSLRIFAQGSESKSLHYYIEAAKANSLLIKDFSNQKAIEQSELERLKAIYTHSRLEMNGNYLFVPIIAKDGGKMAFKWNAQSANDYYGYDLSQSSGSLQGGVTWTKPLLGGSSYNIAQEQAQINTDIANNRIRMEEHQLERSVTERYLLCLLDKAQIDFTDSVRKVLERQLDIVRRLAKSGLSKQSDVNLLMIERQANEELNTAARQDYHTHLMDLNLLCGINNAEDVSLQPVEPSVPLLEVGKQSLFSEQYRLDSLNTVTALNSFNLQYKPRLNFFVNGGMQTGAFSGWYRHFGMSAGLTFSWTLFDGKQRQQKIRQMEWQQNTIATYKQNAEYQRKMRVEQCIDELKRYDEREQALNHQLSEYDAVLEAYGRELNAGQVSVLDYITVLRNKLATEKNRLLLQTNKQLVIAAYNYWNW